MRHLGGALVAVALVAAACSGDDGTATTSTPATTVTATTDVSTTSEPLPASTTTPPHTEPPATEPPADEPGCDDRDARACLLPWPNDRYTVDDPTTATGRRLALPVDGTPANVDGVPIDVTDQNRADGFSPASTIMAFIPDVDLEASGVAPSTDIGASLDDDAPIVLTDLTSGERWPYWAELDAYAPDGEQLLLVRPAIALTEGHRYQVEVDRLVTAEGDPVGAQLPLTWSFTVASADSLSLRLRSMVEASSALVPAFEVEEIDDTTDPMRVTGTFELPNHLDNDGSTGGRFLLGDDGLPVANSDAPTYPAKFLCLVGTAPGPKPTVVYGHGLLGSRGEGSSLAAISQVGGLNVCATDWLGMASEDLGTVAEVLGELSGFPRQADRMLQGQLAFVLLGRLVNHVDGFASHPAFQADDGSSLLDEDGAVFVGNSQGGILGGAASAVSNEWQRAVFGVPGIGYNLLLQRSSNWPRFQEVFEAAYPDPVDGLIALELIQLLWDRGENSGYAQHLTSDPYPGVSPKTVLLVHAFGDHQVANVSTEILARTIGAAVPKPALGPGRSLDVEPMWGIEELESFPTTRSVLSVWDYGTPPPPPVNLPPLPPDYGSDPHGAGSSETNVLLQAITFLTTGEIIDTCGGAPCLGRQIDG